MPTDRRPPWETPAPTSRGGASGKLSVAQIDAARERASRAGRRYPNLIDNMWAMRQPVDVGPRDRDPPDGIDRCLDDVDWFNPPADD